ncbi:PQQ-binding-like beta-propeller repeat protein [Pseudoflavitalea sp. G-6-1-2]|uniref:aryl-sulfate sulfotransferase n=1 Tax=Pseudoflavitalea sp. G-6-1-2 TaxID=2728841 RepID=UPI00146A55D6|nr:aryl-sulfate sulfotransferase [Pseudoflavitalea sp. G-6-1-2]NML22362.1 PQQ-binding-like beta-propeller repeat protein [Pseudoflavitalea sp. G-6-1-2]
MFAVLLNACSDNCSDKLIDISLSSPAGNSMKVEALVHTADSMNAWVEYWEKGRESQIFKTPVSANRKEHKIVITNLQPQQAYVCRIVTATNNCESKSRNYDFKTPAMPVWIHDYFKVICPDSSVVPAAFRDGYMLIYKRETPGIAFIIDPKGQIVWYHQVNGTGFKTAHFTNRQSILCILGNESFQTSYGNQILELSLSGDTLFNQQTPVVHHEAILNNDNNIVTISTEEKILDLSAKGGGKRDTVKSDGIIVLDRQGKTIWKWTVFDALDPLSDPQILKDKSDWMHANSLSIDKDGHYLLSFYNNGQIWKIDSKTGKLIWKFGKGGDFKMPEGSVFDNSHAVHINAKNQLMLFDNGTGKQLSQALAFTLDESAKQASLALQVKLPRDVYSERMGSAYLINDTTVLHTCSKRNTVVLTNLSGRFLWAMKTGIMPYRVEFIPAKDLEPFIVKPK